VTFAPRLLLLVVRLDRSSESQFDVGVTSYSSDLLAEIVQGLLLVTTQTAAFVMFAKVELLLALSDGFLSVSFTEPFESCEAIELSWIRVDVDVTDLGCSKLLLEAVTNGAQLELVARVACNLEYLLCKLPVRRASLLAASVAAA
jgi:hypothetical protein